MLTRAEIFETLAEWRPGASLDWPSAKALSAGSFTDGAGIYHPAFVLNFGVRPGFGADYSDLHFGSKFYFRDTPEISWVNERNREIRFTKVTWEADGIVLSADLYGPDEALSLPTFEGTYVLFDRALVLIRAMATD